MVVTPAEMISTATKITNAKANMPAYITRTGKGGGGGGGDEQRKTNKKSKNVSKNENEVNSKDKHFEHLFAFPTSHKPKEQKRHCYVSPFFFVKFCAGGYQVLYSNGGPSTAMRGGDGRSDKGNRSQQEQPLEGEAPGQQAKDRAKKQPVHHPRN